MASYNKFHQKTFWYVCASVDDARPDIRAMVGYNEYSFLLNVWQWCSTSVPII